MLSRTPGEDSRSQRPVVADIASRRRRIGQTEPPTTAGIQQVRSGADDGVRWTPPAVVAESTDTAAAVVQKKPHPQSLQIRRTSEYILLISICVLLLLLYIKQF